VHVAGLAIFGGFVMFRTVFDEEVAFTAPPEPLKRIEPKKLEYKMRLKQQQQKSSRPKLQPRMLANRLSDMALPEIKTDIKPVMQKPVTSLTGLGQGIGSGFGSGSGSGFGAPGGVFHQRCSPEERLERMRLMNGDPATEAAVVKALHWLMKNQNPDGSWGSQYPVAMTGLSLLAYLGHCEQPGSPVFGQTVDRAINYFVQKGLNEKGYFVPMGNVPASYQNAIAVYALGEAYALTKQARLEPLLSKAGGAIAEGQGSDGGWVYNYEKTIPSDTSLSGWQIQALKAVRTSGAKAPGISAALSRAMANLERVQAPSGAFGYRSVDDARYSLTGVGVLGLQMGNRGKGRSAKQGLRFILEGPKVEYAAKGADIYAWYYNTLACFNEGGDTWTKWNEMFQRPIREAQSADGSWPPTGGGAHDLNGDDADGKVYRTALCTLMLEVFYRYLPSYKE
jgi:hypothetical protein